MELNFEKVDIQIKKLEVGESFVGKLTGIVDRPWTDKKTGETKTIKQYSFTDEMGLNPFAYFGDGGFVNTLTTASIKEGDIIKVIKKNLLDLGGAHKVNTYELFKARSM